jgi:hypothetical protein
MLCHVNISLVRIGNVIPGKVSLGQVRTGYYKLGQVISG